MFGIVTAEVLAAFKKEVQKGLEKLMAEQERRLERKFEEMVRRRATESALDSVRLAGGQEITLEELLVRLQERFKPFVEEGLSSIVGELDVSDLGDRLYRDIDQEAFEERLAALLKEQVLAELDWKALARQLAEMLIEDHLDTDEITDSVVENLSNRVTLSLEPK